MALEQTVYGNDEPERKDQIISKGVAGPKPFITKILHIGGDMGISAMTGAFAGQTKLTEIPADIFDGLTEVTTFAYTFSGCKGLTAIPEKLFDKCLEVTDFGSCFSDCTALTDIPKGLFNNCTKVTSFNWMFATCTGLINIPIELFDNNTKVTNFNNTFKGCTALSGESPYTIINVDENDVKVHLYERANYPEHFTAPVYYWDTFDNCTGLTDYAEITAAGWD